MKYELREEHMISTNQLDTDISRLREALSKFDSTKKTDALYDLLPEIEGRYAYDIPDITEQIDEIKKYSSLIGSRSKVILSLLEQELERQQAAEQPRTLFEEEEFCDKVLKALVNIQKDRTAADKKENDLNDLLVNYLDMSEYYVKDQTRQGISEGGKDAGELDALIEHNGLPCVILEALKAEKHETGKLKTHIQKAITKYDPNGCPVVVIVIYYAGENFVQDCYDKLVLYLDQYDYPFERIGEITQIKTGLAETIHMLQCLRRNIEQVNMHFICSHLIKQNPEAINERPDSAEE